MKHLYEKRTNKVKFEIGDMVLMWNARIEEKGKHGKFDPIWLGPYSISDKNGEGSYFLSDLTRGILELPIHGQFLKRYFSQNIYISINSSFRFYCIFRKYFYKSL